jgi:hypothetical protein
MNLRVIRARVRYASLTILRRKKKKEKQEDETRAMRVRPISELAMMMVVLSVKGGDVAGRSHMSLSGAKTAAEAAPRL